MGGRCCCFHIFVYLSIYFIFCSLIVLNVSREEITNNKNLHISKKRVYQYCFLSKDIVPFSASDLSEDKMTPTLTDHHNGTYDLTFVLQAPGVYYLTVLLFGQHTRGSPYKIRAIDLAEETSAATAGR